MKSKTKYDPSRLIERVELSKKPYDQKDYDNSGEDGQPDE